MCPHVHFFPLFQILPDLSLQTPLNSYNEYDAQPSNLFVFFLKLSNGTTTSQQLIMK